MPKSKTLQTKKRHFVSIASWLRGLTLGRTIKLDGIALVPVLGPPRMEKLPELQTLASALAEGEARVSEDRRSDPSRNQYSVDEFLEIKNKSRDRWLIALPGEIFLGGKRDRILSHALLLAPREERWVRVKAIGLDHDAPRPISTSGALVDPNTRRFAVVPEFDARPTYFPPFLPPINDVRPHAIVPEMTIDKTDWVPSGVIEAFQRSSAKRPFESYTELLDIWRRRARAVESLIAWNDQQLGLITFAEGEPAAADIFADPALFRAYRHHLLTALMSHLGTERADPETSLSAKAQACFTRLQETSWIAWKKVSQGTATKREKSQCQMANPCLISRAHLWLAQGTPVYLSSFPAAYPSSSDAVEAWRQVVESPRRSPLPQVKVFTEEDSVGSLSFLGPWTLVPTHFDLGPGRFVLGRSSGCDISLSDDDPTVSRRHLELQVREDGSAAIRDLGSSYGSRMKEENVLYTELRPGQRVRIGDATILWWFKKKVVATKEDKSIADKEDKPAEKQS